MILLIRNPTYGKLIDFIPPAHSIYHIHMFGAFK